MVLSVAKEFIAVVLASVKRQTGAESVELQKVLTDSFWTVYASFRDGSFQGEPSYKFRVYTVDVSGSTPKVLGLWD